MYKLVSSQRIIAKLHRDLRLTDNRYVSDIIEWIGEAMHHVRAYPNMEQKVEELTVTMHRVALPNDLAMIRQVARTSKKGGDDLCIMSYNASHFPQSLHTRDSPNKMSQEAENRYIINMNYIETTFEEGFIVLSYLAFPTDDDGYPMVPKEVSFDEAAKWYIVLRMIEGGWKHPAGISYDGAEQRWHHYCAQARQKFKMPDIDQYQKFLEMWVRLTPDYSRHHFGFDDADYNKTDYTTAQELLDISPSP